MSASLDRSFQIILLTEVLLVQSMSLDMAVPSTTFIPFSAEAKAAAAKVPMQHHPAFFHTGGFTIPFDEMYAWMKRVNYPFDIQPPETDPLEVMDFAEHIVPPNLCLQAFMDGEISLSETWIIYFPTRAEYVAPSIIRRDLQRPTLEPFTMREEDLPMREWLLNTAGTFGRS